jgi:acyl-coenzyme A thioesterase PaaI-like protein
MNATSHGTIPSKDEIIAFIAREFPQTRCVVEAVGAGSATVIHPVGDAELRPGGTVSGPVMMAVADVAIYIAVLGAIGIVPLAVTTNFSINFLRKPESSRNIVAVSKLLKLGKSLAVGEVAVYSQGHEPMVAHAVGTYSIPPQRR